MTRSLVKPLGSCRDPFLTQHDADGIVNALTNFGEHQMEETGGQRNSIAQRLLCKRSEAAGPIVRGARPVWSAGHRSILGHDFTLIASDLGGRRLSGFGCLGIAKLRPLAAARRRPIEARRAAVYAQGSAGKCNGLKRHCLSYPCK